MRKLLLILLVVSCSGTKNSTDISGTYTSDMPGAAEQFLSDKSYTTGDILELHKDSTYIFTTCAQIYHGNWKVSKDSLYLYCNNVSFKIDSLNTMEQYKKGTICGTAPEAYSIDGTVLLNRAKFKGAGYLYTRLKKQ